MPLKVVWRDGFAHLHGTVAGKRVRRSAKTRDAEVAERIRAETESRLIKVDLYGPENEATFAEACYRYLDEGKRRRYLAPLIRHLGRQRLAAITPGALTSLAVKLYPMERYTNSTRNTCVLKPARAVINFAHQHGLCPPMKVKAFYEAQVDRPAGDRAWIDAFMAACTDEERRLRVLCLFMWVTGARIGECIKLEPDHLDLDAKRGVGPPTKNGDPRTYYLTDELVRELRTLPPRRVHYGRGSELVFGWSCRQSAYQLWVKVCKRAGLAVLTPHEAGRHGFGTETVVRQKLDVVTAAKLGGWRDPTVLLRRYAHARGLDTTAEAIFGTENTPFKGTPVTRANPSAAQRIVKSA